jgi:exonuclease III
MAHWTRPQLATQAWDYLDKNIAADITLLQECVPPKDRQGDFCVWKNIVEKGKWGSGVLTKRHPIKELCLEKNDNLGALTVAEVSLPNKPKLVVISMYSQFDKYKYTITALHRMLSDLTYLLDGCLQQRGRPTVILGGDLNASPQWDDEYGTKTHRIFFQRLEASGLVDCHGAFTKDRPHTQRHARSKIPWVNGFIFVSKNLENKIVSHEVIENAEMKHLSDHNPLVVTFDF